MNILRTFAMLCLAVRRRFQSGFCLLVLLFANLQLFAAVQASTPACCSGVICPMHHSQASDKSSLRLCGSAKHSAKTSPAVDCAPGCCQRPQVQVVASNTFVLPQPTGLNRQTTFADLHVKAASLLLSALQLIDTPPPRLPLQA